MPVELVIDHWVIAEVSGTTEAFAANMGIELERNVKRYQLLRWAQQAFEGLAVVPPDMGTCHQVNREDLTQVAFNTQDGNAFPGTLVGTDSHTPMVNGFGVLGWGVGGIEADATMLGQPLPVPMPAMIGVELSRQLPPVATAPDLVLTMAELLRRHGVVGNFVELTGPGLTGLRAEHRATFGNMAPEYGTTCAFSPHRRPVFTVVDDISHEDLRVLLREEGVSFQVIKTWKQSTDPDFEAKKNRVLHLYAIADGKAKSGYEKRTEEPNLLL